MCVCVCVRCGVNGKPVHGGYENVTNGKWWCGIWIDACCGLHIAFAIFTRALSVCAPGAAFRLYRHAVGVCHINWTNTQIARTTSEKHTAISRSNFQPTQPWTHWVLQLLRALCVCAEPTVNAAVQTTNTHSITPFPFLSIESIHTMRSMRAHITTQRIVRIQRHTHLD